MLEASSKNEFGQLASANTSTVHDEKTHATTKNNNNLFLVKHITDNNEEKKRKEKKRKKKGSVNQTRKKWES